MSNNSGNFHPKVTGNQELPRAQAIPLVQLLCPAMLVPMRVPHASNHPFHEEEPRDFDEIMDEIDAVLDQDDFMDNDVDIFDLLPAGRDVSQQNGAANGNGSLANQ